MNSRLFQAVFCLILAGCMRPGSGETPAGTPTIQPPSPVFTVPPETPTVPANTSTPVEPIPSPTYPPAASTEILPVVCAPLADLTAAGLAEAIVNPYHPPPFGSDDPHQGIDIAAFLAGTRIAVSGQEVRAALEGTVTLVLADRYPYGNALLVETPLEPLIDLGLEIPAGEAATPIASALTCPGETAFEPGGPERSLYLLYAHMQDPPEAAVGETLACGAPLGRIGETGNALNPHLHLEARIGPSGFAFPGMSHYTGSASPAEMDAYCTWRIGGRFRPIDPGLIFMLTEW